MQKEMAYMHDLLNKTQLESNQKDIIYDTLLEQTRGLTVQLKTIESKSIRNSLEVNLENLDDVARLDYISAGQIVRNVQPTISEKPVFESLIAGEEPIVPKLKLD